MNDFGECLQFSHSASDLPIWGQVYRLAFPTLIAMVDHREDGDHQRAGIDRSLTLANSKQILVDEKVRRRNRRTGRVYDDILLEYVSDDRRGTPGWVCKPLRADYIAYAIAPLGRCYLLPVCQLQLAWKRHGDVWRNEYGTREAQNNGYLTLNTPVPPVEVFKAITRALFIHFDPLEIED